jgi:hypothetical protein
VWGPASIHICKDMPCIEPQLPWGVGRGGEDYREEVEGRGDEGGKAEKRDQKGEGSNEKKREKVQDGKAKILR